MKIITNSWIKIVQGKKGFIIERRSYIVNGTVYAVDGVHIILKPPKHEREIAEILSKKYGKIVELVPQIVYPQGIQTPDYLIDGERFDLKSPTGSGKHLIYDLIAKKRKQAGNEKEPFIEPVNHSKNGTRGSRTTLFLPIIYHSS